MSRTTPAIANARYCLERVVAEFIQPKEGQDVHQRVTELDDEQLAKATRRVIDSKCGVKMPRLEQLLEELLQAGPEKEGACPQSPSSPSPSS